MSNSETNDAVENIEDVVEQAEDGYDAEVAADDYDTEIVETEVIERAPIVIDRPIQTVGRRKEAVVPCVWCRVRDFS